MADKRYLYIKKHCQYRKDNKCCIFGDNGEACSDECPILIELICSHVNSFFGNSKNPADILRKYNIPIPEELR